MWTSLKRFTNRKLPLNRAIISDIVLWVFLTLLLAFLIYQFAVTLPAKSGQTITLPFRDANEISKGSSVRMMGTEIGFVDDVHILQDHVEIKIQTYPGTLKIPSGARFTILFTGLAGAKSIEVDLPTQPQPRINGHPLYLVEEPIRMKDTLNSSIDVTQALQKGAENITDFFGKKKPVEELQFNIRQAHQMSTVAVSNTQALNAALQDLTKEVATNTLEAIDTLSGLNRGSQRLVSLTQPDKLRSDFHRATATLHKFNSLFQAQTSGAAGMVSLPKRLSQLNQANGQLAYQLKHFNARVQQFPLAQWLNNLSQGQGQFQDFLSRADQFFAEDRLPALKQARHTIQKFNQKLETFNQKITQTSQTSQPTKTP